MADALASGASIRKDVGVQVPPRPRRPLGGTGRPEALHLGRIGAVAMAGRRRSCAGRHRDAPDSVRRAWSDQPIDEHPHVVMEVGVIAYASALPVREGPQGRWKLVGSGKSGAVDKHRCDRNATLESGFNFDAYPVVWLVEPPAALVRCVEPSRPDEHDHELTLCDHRVKMASKVHTEWNRVDIEE